MLLQHLKLQLKQITRMFTNPFHHLLLTALPWLPTARRDRFSYQAVEKVSLVCHARHCRSKSLALSLCQHVSLVMKQVQTHVQVLVADVPASKEGFKIHSVYCHAYIQLACSRVCLLSFVLAACTNMPQAARHPFGPSQSCLCVFGSLCL